eukprot:TRINITY_DN1734_c0_g3_i1.p1 TRINITY_DN1734_c0_g3~~TRINITY_DN1734_c0_g3_i1.p1  ORF type:complete len:227 (+),score=34.99 TRINITY_DN1734_c0_g3_i1:56-682(+)
MPSGMENVCACNIRTLSGEEFFAEVEISWNIEKLREYMCRKFGIPEYEQHYLRASVRLLSSDLVCNSHVQRDDCLDLTLVWSSMPDCLSKAELQQCWYYFLTFSRDHGDTVDGTFKHLIARMASMDVIACAIREEPVNATSVSFVDLMSHFAQLKPAPVEEVLIDSMLVDVGRTTCPRLQAANRLVDNEAPNADEDATDYESDDDMGW